jgi:4-amino-4-deoxy-L-arabinose transferase-like glycosyltransferase
MALFGMPQALGLPGRFGDTRPWLIAVTLVLLAASIWIAARRRGGSRGGEGARRRAGLSAAVWAAVFAVGSPVLALELAVGITDGPVIALVCLALACVARSASQQSPRLLTLAGLAVGLACAMKFTAWPALPVIAAMLWARDGRRVAARFAGVSVGTAVVLVAAFAPRLLAHLGTLVQNVVLFPLGMTPHKTPAASPAGHVAAIVVLIAAGLAVAASLVLRPPMDLGATVVRLAVGLVLLFALAPASRFGYFCYPIALLGWLALIRLGRAGPGPATDGFASSADLPVPTVTPSQRDGAGSAATGRARPG